MHSDSRIFVSDGNVTMKALADSREYFNSQCSALFARMIDTVPREVQLTQPITPYPVKPFGMLLYLMNETALRLEGNIRVSASGGWCVCYLCLTSHNINRTALRRKPFNIYKRNYHNGIVSAMSTRKLFALLTASTGSFGRIENSGPVRRASVVLLRTTTLRSLQQVSSALLPSWKLMLLSTHSRGCLHTLSITQSQGVASPMPRMVGVGFLCRTSLSGISRLRAPASHRAKPRWSLV